MFYSKISKLKIYGTDNEKKLTDVFAVNFLSPKTYNVFNVIRTASHRLFEWRLLKKNHAYIIQFLHIFWSFLKATFQ